MDVAIINKKHAEDSLKLPNSKDSEIKLSIELQTNNYLLFLDVKIIKDFKSIKFGIHRKGTEIDNYVSSNVFNISKQS